MKHNIKHRGLAMDTDYESYCNQVQKDVQKISNLTKKLEDLNRYTYMLEEFIEDYRGLIGDLEDEVSQLSFGLWEVFENLGKQDSISLTNC